DALLVAGPDVADRDDLKVLRIVLAHEHAALVAGPDQRGLYRPVGQPGVVVAVIRGRGDARGGAGGNQAFHEVAPVDAALRIGELADDALEVGLAGLALLGGQVNGHRQVPLGSGRKRRVLHYPATARPGSSLRRWSAWLAGWRGRVLLTLR